MTFQPRLLEPTLTVPEAIQPSLDHQLPSVSFEVLGQLQEHGWSRVGLMVAFVTEDGQVMMLEHHARDKNAEGVLGPLGETSKQSGPIIEQPLETLYRGIQEELGIQEPARLDLWMYQAGGWAVNQWPRGEQYPGEFACAISFPIFISDAVRKRLEAIPRATDEIGGVHFMNPTEILEAPDHSLRPGVKSWLNQLGRVGLLDPADFGAVTQVNFDKLYQSSLEDIVLGHP